MADSGSGDLLLVTGASGFAGSAVARAAREAGYRVRVLVRPSSPRTNVHPDDEIRVGDIRDRASLRAALKGVRYVIHAAANYRLWAPVPDEIIRTNLDGTRLVMEEALVAGVERVVHTSSVATVALNDASPAHEPHSLLERDAVGAYKKSKVMAERLVEDMVKRRTLRAVIVNPSTPIGPRDVKPTPTGRIIIEAAAGRMPAFVDTGLNFVHVDDVAAGHLAALRRGRTGERYILGGENVYLRGFLAAVAAIRRAGAPRGRRGVGVPMAPLSRLGAGAEAGARLTGREPFLTRDGLRMARHHMFFNDAKARGELGYSSRPYRDGLADAIAWFRKAGYLQ